MYICNCLFPDLFSPFNETYTRVARLGSPQSIHSIQLLIDYEYLYKYQLEKKGSQ